MLCENCLAAIRRFYLAAKESLKPVFTEPLGQGVLVVESSRPHHTIEHGAVFHVGDPYSLQCCWISEAFVNTLKVKCPEVLNAEKPLTLLVSYKFRFGGFSVYPNSRHHSGLLTFEIALDNPEKHKVSATTITISLEHYLEHYLDHSLDDAGSIRKSLEDDLWMASSVDKATFNQESSCKSCLQPTGYTVNNSLISRWLSTCLEKHKQCKTAARWQPPRLLFVGNNEGGGPMRVVPSTSKTSVTYAALSHRWPQDVQTIDYLRLLRGNVDDLQTVLQPDLLPKAFRDSIDLVRSLGIFYIWIDALCIIQDDFNDRDWLNHVKIMHQVYREAILTVSLSGLRDSSENIQNNRCRGFSRDWRFMDDMYCCITPSEDWQNTVIRTPLGSRGWVFQERLLSTRVLHIGRYQSAWECRTNCCAEGFDALEFEKTTSKDRWLLIKGQFNILTLSEFQESLDQGYIPRRLWTDLVQNYTSRELTQSSDVLPSFQGFANAVFENTATTCLFGLRADQLYLDLAWMRARTISNNAVQAPREDRDIPTWSWASGKGQCYLPGTIRLPDRYMATLRSRGRIRDTRDVVSLVHQVSPSTTALRNGRLLYLRAWLCTFDIYEIQLDGEITRYGLNGVYMPAHEFAVATSSSLPRTQLQALSQEKRLFFMPTALRRYAVCGVLVTEARESSLRAKPGLTTWMRVGAVDIVFQYPDYDSIYREIFNEALDGETWALKSEILGTLSDGSREALGLLKYCGVSYRHTPNYGELALEDIRWKDDVIRLEWDTSMGVVLQ